MYSISVFIGDQSNTTHGETRHFETFEKLSHIFSKCNQGRKHSSYFVRGALDPVERLDKNMASSRLLIIDADIGVGGENAPSPYLVGRKLKMRGINHFIYTSHSHSDKQNKFRVVVPTKEPYVKEHLDQLMKGLLKGLGVGWVKEMGVMSQPWFSPTRDDPSDGLFKFSSFFEGEDYEQEIKAEKEAEVSGQVEEGRASSLDELHENIRTGKELHESLRTLTFQWVRDGMSKANVKSMARTIMNGSSEAGTERWQTRYDDIDRMVDKVDQHEDVNFDLDEPEKTALLGAELPAPPGLLGDLYDSAHEFLLLQSKEVAFASALGAVAAVVGRKFNVMQPMPAGLNVFLTIIADTGCGKDRINDFIRLCIMSHEDGVKSYASFIAPSHFYGPKAIVDHFNNARSGISIISEGGMMMKVKSGNVEAKTAFMLDALQCSHAHGYTKAHGYSKSEDSLPSIRAMAMSVVSESTSSQMDEAWKETGALNSGYLPRQICLKIERNVIKSNRKIINSLPASLIDRFHELCEKCSAVQAEADPKVHELEFDDGLLEDYYDYYDRYLALRDEHAGIDGVKSNMASRVAQKAIRLAGLSTVFNKSANSTKCLIIEKQEWEWAKRFCDYEYENISSVLAGISGNQDMDNACLAVYNKIVNILENHITDKKCQIDVRYRNKKLIPYSKIKIACKNNPSVTSINDKYGSMNLGVDKVLKHMEDNKAIKFLSSDPLGGRSPRVIQILPGINDYGKQLD